MLACAGALLIFGLFLARLPPLPIAIDDAFITYRYARNLAEGHGLVFNIGERVEGITNALWAILLAVGSRLTGMPVADLAPFLGTVFCLMSMILLAIVTIRRLEKEGMAPLSARLVGWTAACLMPVHPMTGVWAESGLEVGMIQFLLAGCLLPGLSPGALFGLGVLLFLVRPDGGLWLFSLVLFDEAFRKGAHGHLTRFWWIGLALGVVILVTGLRFAYYGDFVPNTFYAKVESFTPALGWLEIVEEFSGGLWFLWLAGAVGLAGLGKDRANLLFWPYVIYIIFLGRDTLGFARFYHHLQPIACFMCAAGVVSLTRRYPWPVPFVALVVVGSVLWSTQVPMTTLGEYVIKSQNWQDLGRWLANHTRPETLVAVNPIGIIGYESRRPILDMLGLVDRVIARTPIPAGSPMCLGHRRHNPEYVLARKPDLIFLEIASSYPRPATNDHLTYYASITVYPGDRGILRSELCRRDYELANIPLEVGRFVPVLVRRQTRERILAPLTAPDPGWGRP